MFKELDLFLEDYATDDSGILNYWFDSAYEDAVAMLEQFSDEDWKELFKEINNRSDLWKERLIYCFEDKNNQYQIRLLEEMLNTENDALFIKVIDALRVDFDMEMLKYNKEILVKRINELIPKVGSFNSNMLLEFLNKIETDPRKVK